MKPASATEGSEAIPEVERLVESYRDMAQHATPPVALGAFYAYESQIPAVAEAKLAGLKSFYGASDAACLYFVVHRTADIAHAAVWRALIESSIEENPRTAFEVLEGVKRGAEALWHVLDGIEAARHKLAIE